MNTKDSAIIKIKRNYRINPSADLLAFWEAVESKNLSENQIPFRYFQIQLFTLEQVAAFEYKDIRFWFNHRGKHFLVKYYIPIANIFFGSSIQFAAAYDHSKNFIGVFLVNQNEDPIFITSDLFSLLNNITPTIAKEDFQKEKISKILLLDCDLDQSHPEEEEKEYYDYSTAEIIEFGNQRLLKLLEYLQLVYNAMYPDFKFNFKTLKDAHKIFFTPDQNKNWKIVKPVIEIPKYKEHTNSSDLIISILNRVNFEWWSEDSKKGHKYGFYRLDKSIVMLHIEQLAEFIRLGIIPTYNNVIFPSIVHSAHPSGYSNSKSYEVRTFETQAAYDEWYKNYMDEKDILTVRLLEEQDIPSIVDYFLDKGDLQITGDGFDLAKIPFEDQMVAELKNNIATPNANKKQFNVILEEGAKAYGHCYIDNIKDGTAYFSFYNWVGLLNRIPIIDGLLSQAIQLMIDTYSLTTIFAAITKSDSYRQEAYERLGFEFVEEREFQRDDWGDMQKFKIWKKTF